MKILNIVECYNFKIKIWSVMLFMFIYRYGFGVVVLEGFMYVVGGYDGWSYLNIVE